MSRKPKSPAAQPAHDVMSLMPDTTPAYMAPAWLGCVQWAIGSTEVIAQFRAETGETWTPGRSGIEHMIDRATGADWMFIERFVRWVNAEIWGDVNALDEPDATDAREEGR